MTVDATALNGNLPAGLPSDLMQRRPDVAEAEYTLRAANANIGAARAAFYPTVTLTSSGGSEVTSESHRLAEARFQHGADTYLNVLDAERSLYSAQQTLISTQLGQASNLVTLYKVLGGGLNEHGRLPSVARSAISPAEIPLPANTHPAARMLP